MGGIRRDSNTFLHRGDLIHVPPVRAAEAGQSRRMHTLHRLDGALVFPMMNLSMPVREREHPIAAMPAGGEIEERFTIDIPTNEVPAFVEVVLMNIHEDAHSRAGPSHYITT